MRNCIICLFFLIGTAVYGQVESLNSYLSWFNKADVESIKNTFKNTDFRLMDDKDSSGFHLLRYTMFADGIAPSFTFFVGDTALLHLMTENYAQNVHKEWVAQLKSNKFGKLNADVNGDFITTVYDNGQFIFCQDYEVVDNPLGKGQIPHYRYRIYRKNGKFDTMNGTKKKSENIDGKAFTVIENYRNGVLDGERIIYFPGDSIIKKKENYRAGRLNGTVSDFDSLGRLIHSSIHSYHWKYGIEKWYDGQGKVIRSLQWQRDVPVGSDKFNINGRTFNGPTYKNGKLHGLATVPVNMKWNRKYDVTNAAIPQDLNWENTTASDFYVGAVETVLFVEGLKNGKAIGMSAHSSDTVYIAYYKNGVLDSVFNAYQDADFSYGYKNEPRFRTAFENGLENGKRTFYVMSGPNKGEISAFETYENGKLNGETVHYFKKEQDQMIPPTDPGENPWADHPIKYIPGEWMKDYSLLTYKNGILNGPFHFQTDSMNYSIGTYVDGKIDGKQETESFFYGKRIRKIQNYDKGIPNGEWITEYLPDSVVNTENYLNNKKHGIFSKKLKGQILQEENYVSDFLYEFTLFHGNGYDKYTFVTNEIPDSYSFSFEEKSFDVISIYNYTANTIDFPKSDSVLILLQDALMANRFVKANGRFEIKGPNYEKTGSYTDNLLSGYVVIKHKNAGVYEQLMYENDSIRSYGYTHVSTSEAFTGTFISDVDGSSVSVKNGLRHGWFIEYDENHKEIKRTKYVKGILKKTIEG